jgi:hypothetical protein
MKGRMKRHAPIPQVTIVGRCAAAGKAAVIEAGHPPARGLCKPELQPKRPGGLRGPFRRTGQTRRNPELVFNLGDNPVLEIFSEELRLKNVLTHDRNPEMRANLIGGRDEDCDCLRSTPCGWAAEPPNLSFGSIHALDVCH